MPSSPQAEPAVLLVGAGEAMEAALAQALDRHGVFVDTAAANAVVDAVVAAAPDLILLVGDAARDCGSEVLAELAASPLSSVVPVAILDDNAALDARLKAFRHGAAAIIPYSASADAIADQVARLAREIPDRGGGSLGNIESTLEDLISTLGKELRTGVLSVRGEQDPEADAVRLVLGGGQPLTEMIDEFVARLRGHVVLAEPLRYEFDERAGGTVQLLGGDSIMPSKHVDVSGVRILLADDDAARADAVAQQLRSSNATVVVTDLDPTAMRFERLRQVDPTVLLIGDEQLQGEGYELIRRMRRDTRLRWASLLVVRWNEVWGDNADVPAVHRLLGTLADLNEPERAVSERADLGEPFDTRLEAMGPTRLLRSLTHVSHPVRLTVFNPRVQVKIEISNELIVSANTHILGQQLEQLEGAPALAAFIVLGSGRAHVESVSQPSSTNLMAPIDVALDMADAEAPPIPPSLPSPASDSVRPPAQSGAPAYGTVRPPPAAASAVVPTAAAPTLPPMSVEAAPPSAAMPAAPASIPVPASMPAPPASVAPPSAAPAGMGPMSEPPISMESAELVSIRPEAPPAPLPMAAPGAEVDDLDLIPMRRGPRAGLIGWIVLGIVLVAGAFAAIVAFSHMFSKRAPATAKSAARAATPPKSTASMAVPPTGTASAAAPAKSAVAVAKSADSSAAPADSSAAPAAGSAASASPAAAHPRLPVIRHSRAPTCKQLLAKDPPTQHGLPGAAYRAILDARRGLVRGDMDAAGRAYCRAVRMDAKSVTAAVELTRLFLLRRDGFGASKWARLAGKRGADDATVKGLLGDALALTGNFKQARDAWVAANSGQPGDPSAVAALAAKSLAIGRNALRVRAYSRAERYFRRAIVLAPEHGAAAIGLARALLYMDVPDDALVWVRYAIAEAPKSADGQVLLGDVLHRKGQHVQARRAWKKALALEPGNPAAESRLRKL